VIFRRKNLEFLQVFSSYIYINNIIIFLKSLEEYLNYLN